MLWGEGLPPKPGPELLCKCPAVLGPSVLCSPWLPGLPSFHGPAWAHTYSQKSGGCPSRGAAPPRVGTWCVSAHVESPLMGRGPRVGHGWAEQVSIKCSGHSGRTKAQSGPHPHGHQPVEGPSRPCNLPLLPDDPHRSAGEGGSPGWQGELKSLWLALGDIHGSALTWPCRPSSSLVIGAETGFCARYAQVHLTGR